MFYNYIYLILYINMIVIIVYIHNVVLFIIHTDLCCPLLNFEECYHFLLNSWWCWWSSVAILATKVNVLRLNTLFIKISMVRPSGYHIIQSGWLHHNLQITVPMLLTLFLVFYYFIDR